MNWDAIGAIGEIIGALAVVITLAYLAVQVRYAKQATSDQNRLVRANGVREMALAAIQNDDLRDSLSRDWGMTQHYVDLGKELGVEQGEVSRADWANAYYFWLHWGQYASTHDPKDRKELENIIRSFYTIPGVRRTWDSSFLAKPTLDPEFVSFVEEILDDDRDADSG